MDTKEKRDCVFVYMWVLCKIMASTACMDGADKIYVETALIEGLMGRLDKGGYSDDKGHVLGWAITVAASLLRDSLAHCYVGRVHVIDMSAIPEDRRHSLIADVLPIEELVDLANIEDMIYLLPDDDQVRVLWMYFIDGMSQQEIAEVMDIGNSTVSRVYMAGINELNRMHNKELEHDIKQSGQVS